MSSHISPFNYALAVLLVIAASILPATAGTASNQPTQYEQYMLQLINRARTNGNAEMTRLGNAPSVTVNEGPPTVSGHPWTINNSMQPLAWNTQLTAAAQSHADNLQSVDWQFNSGTYGNNPHRPNSNFPGGATIPADRIAAAGYTIATSGYRASNGSRPGAENIVTSSSSSSNGWSHIETLNVFNTAHESLFEDFTVPGRGHRNTTMYEVFREVGLGTALGFDNSGGLKESCYMVQNFGRSSSVANPFLTGLAYNDLDSNNFFTPALTPISESITGLTVQARQSGVTMASVAAFETGGYSLPLSAGSYQIFFVKADGTEHSAGTVVMGVDNVELNAKNPTFVATYTSWIASFPGAAAAPDFMEDADDDGIPNGVEHVLGTSPAVNTTGLYQVSKQTSTLKFRHSRSNSIIAGITHSYQWSTDLTNWHSSGQTNAGGTNVSITTSNIVDNVAPLLDVVEVSATINSGPNVKLFVRLTATQ